MRVLYSVSGKLVLFPVSAPRFFKIVIWGCLFGRFNSKGEEEVKSRSHHRLFIYDFFIPSCNTFANVPTTLHRLETLPSVYKPVCGYSGQSLRRLWITKVYHKRYWHSVLVLRIVKHRELFAREFWRRNAAVGREILTGISLFCGCWIQPWIWLKSLSHLISEFAAKIAVFPTSVFPY